MKILKVIIAVLILGVMLGGCTKNINGKREHEHVDFEMSVVTGEAKEVIRATEYELCGIASIKGSEDLDAQFWFLVNEDLSKLPFSPKKGSGWIPNTGGEFSAVVKGLKPETEYLYRVYLAIDGEIRSGEVRSFTTKSLTQSGVDLGMEVCWAECNLGADTLGAPGKFFAWGETKESSEHDWDNYRWANGDKNKLIKYCPSDASEYWDYSAKPEGPDNLVTLLPEDDAATAILGNGWRMPTAKEIATLAATIENRVDYAWTWKKVGGNYGWEVKHRKSANSIFLPALGRMEKSVLLNSGLQVEVWSSDLLPSYPYSVKALIIENNDSSPKINSATHPIRPAGLPIRPVRDK